MNTTRIRAITFGLNLAEFNTTDLVSRLTKFYTAAETAYNNANFPVQTRRLTLPPMSASNLAECYQIKSTVDSINRIADQTGIRWLCLPLANHSELSNESIQVIINIIKQYPKVFLNLMVTENNHISSAFCTSAARTILAVSRLSNNGYDNFRVGVGANIKPNTPYFPFSYHQGKSGFSLAVELIGHLIHTVKHANTTSLDLLRQQLIDTITPIITEIDAIGLALEEQTGFTYKGQDISIAPFPDEVRSVATLIELLGPTNCGQSGTLMITSLLTDVLKTAIKQTSIRHTGFNGVMFSPLEDRELANSNNQRHLSIEKLMLYSAVCGCGIDMVPVAGDVFEEELNNLILDVAGLSCILQKPLGVRVLPIPMKTTNELTNFNHDFLTNTRIMPIDGQLLAYPLSSEQGFRYLRFDEQKNIRELQK